MLPMYSYQGHKLSGIVPTAESDSSKPRMHGCNRSHPSGWIGALRHDVSHSLFFLFWGVHVVRRFLKRQPTIFEPFHRSSNGGLKFRQII